MTSTVDLRLESLVGALTWDSASAALAREWKAAYVCLLRERFDLIVHIDSSGLLEKAAELMNREELESFLLDPRVSWRLVRNAETDSVNALQSEMLRALDEDATTYGGLDEKGFENGCLRLRELIVDLRSSYDCPSREPGELALAHVPAEIERPALELIEDSIDLLTSKAPNVSDFVRSLTTRIVIRSDLARPDSFASGSFCDHAGLTLIVNPQALAGDALRLIDAVVHEAVHAAIYMYEPTVAPLCRATPSELRLKSCWSGRMLTLDQYVQACFVWWGLLNLWRIWLVQGREQQAQKLLERAARGFSLRPISILRQKTDTAYLDERTWGALFEIEAKSSTVF